MMPHQQSGDERLLTIIDQIRTARNNIADILSDLCGTMLSLFDAERLAIYACNLHTNEMALKFHSPEHVDVRETCVPMNTKSIAGFVAVYGRTMNIANAYDHDELKCIHHKLEFDSREDQDQAFRTKQVLCVPINLHFARFGVLQFLNKRTDQRFTAEDAHGAEEIASVMGEAFRRQRMIHRHRESTYTLLVNESLISPSDLTAAYAMAKRKGVDVASVLMTDYRIPKADIGRSLSARYECQFIDFDERISLPTALISKVQDKTYFLEKNLWVPIKLDDDQRVTVLMDNPHDPSKLDAIRLILQASGYTYVVGIREDILRYILRIREGMGLTFKEAIDDLETKEATPDGGEEGDVSESDSGIIWIANQTIRDAFKAGASDIHIEPNVGQRKCVIRFRIDGACIGYHEIPLTHSNALLSRLKIMAQLDISERRKPQDGKITFKVSNDHRIELRMATMPTQGGREDAVLRLLPSTEPLPLEQMKLSENNLSALLDVLTKPHGLILVVGPTGSGKTTTLHAVLKHLNTPERKIWTAEDPVEITQEGLRQVQVHSKIGFTFAMAMRSFLRLDPDIIMVGEMRDEETARTGTEASLTGHLVLSTLHTNSAPETIVRLLDMGMDPFNFSDALCCVLAQRLGRTLCSGCKVAYSPTEKEWHTLLVEYGEHLGQELLPFSPTLTLYKPGECRGCRNTGYRGRIGLHELLVGTDAIKTLIAERAPVKHIRDQAIADGMRTLKQDGIHKILQGFIDLQQVRAVCL